jgi:hypothetical protein
VTLDDLRLKKEGSTQMKKKLHPKDCIQNEEKMGFLTPLDGGVPFTMIRKGMDRWIFSSNSLVIRSKEIIDRWRLGKEGFPFIFVGQGKEALGEGF